MPGFIDAHNHLSIAAFAPDSVDCSTPPLSTLDEVLAAIEKHCKTLPAGQWARGMGFHMLQIREQRNPTRYELNEVAPHNPFVLLDASCHAVYANSLALNEVGISAHSPQPWGGEIEFDKTGEPTGTLFETTADPLPTALSRTQHARRGCPSQSGLRPPCGTFLSVEGIVRRVDTSLLMGDLLTRATVGYKSSDVP